MKKALYELKISESLEHLMPPLSDTELRLLRASLISEGCRDPLVTWNGTLVDGHNRYAICHEHGIPFNCVEMQFADEAEARRWIIRNQLARRNLPDYVKCEMVLPLEAELKAEAEKRMLAGKKAHADPVENFPQGQAKTRTVLADIAGVSDRTFDKAKKLSAEADEATKDKLRKGELSIHGAYTALRQEDPERPQRIHNSRVILPPERSAEHLAPPSDDVYAQPPISAVPPDGTLPTHGIVAAFRDAGARYLEDVLSAILNATPEELAATGDELLAEAEKTHRAVIAAIGDARIDKGGDDGM